MAITKLLHMKESPSFPSNHLKDTINYILDVKNGGKKTEYGLWTGGNVGTEAGEVYQKFMDTKRAWGKTRGRQGYHFVISFAPGETDAATCFAVVKEFCEKYLGNDYEYVFAIHNDKDHIHGHVVFNSVSRTTGYKYRYEKGDWEKYIQPITDEITKSYGLSPLELQEKRKGKSYGEWVKEKQEKPNWISIIRADVDLAIKNSSSMEEFFLLMKEMGYTFPRSGEQTTKDGKVEKYITFCFTDAEGKTHRRRNTQLLSGTDEYSLANIRARIEDKSKTKVFYHEQIALLLERKLFLRLGNTRNLNSLKTYGRLYQAVNYYKLPNPFAVPPYQVRMDILRIDRLIDECIYIKNNPPGNTNEFLERALRLDENLKSLYIKRKALKGVQEESKLLVPQETAEEYLRLKKALAECSREDDTWEKLEDQIEVLEEDLPAAFISQTEDLVECEARIKLIKREKKVLEHIIEMEGGEMPILAEEMPRTEPNDKAALTKKRRELR